MGDCLLWAVFPKNCRSSPKFWATFFQSIDYVLILTKKYIGLHYGRFFFHERNWSPCPLSSSSC
jgi:hypothetical protein